MSPAEIDLESRCRIPLPRREDLDTAGHDYFTLGTEGILRGLHWPRWLMAPRAKAGRGVCSFRQLPEIRAPIAPPIKPADYLILN